MDKTLEKLNNLLISNEKWQNANPTTQGNENPYPPKIENTFLKYYNKHYEAVVNFVTEEEGSLEYTAEKSDIENSLYNAWFDCTTIEECFDTLEFWIRDYQESYIEYEELTLVGEIEVKSVEKKK